MSLERRFHYPPTPQSDVVENFHGTRVPDPYDWLADPESAQTQRWQAEQNAFTQRFLASLPECAQIRQRLTEVWDYDKYGTPVAAGGHYFLSKQTGLQNQGVIYRLDSLHGSPVELIDPNTLSSDGTVALTQESYSHDGRFLAYCLSEGGSDWQSIRIRRTADGTDLDETLRWCKFTRIAWRRDSSGFFYNRFPDPTLLPEAEQGLFNMIYWHALGTPQSQDLLVYSDPDQSELIIHPMVSDDGAYVVLAVRKGTDATNRLYYRPIDSDGPFVRLLAANDAYYDFVGNVGTRFFLQTNHGAPRRRVIAIDLDRPAPEHWQEIVPEGSGVLQGAACINGELIVIQSRDVHHELERFDLEGVALGSITLPTLGSISEITGGPYDHEMFISFKSFLHPTTIFRFDFAAERLEIFLRPAIKFDSEAYETNQVFYPSKDGTRVPMFVVHKKGLVLDGCNPTLLYGYGGFNVSLMPEFTPMRVAWLDQGGVYALAGLRGGNEYGEEWHRAGQLENKQTVFDDFIAASEWLIANGYTQAHQLGIAGGSNGGLLVAACMVQRPDLFGGVLCQVPVIDMLHYHTWTIGHYWIGEHGNAEANPDHFRFMYAYSPLHNLQPGTIYPPTIITTAEVDDRVVPAHAKKFAAALQAADAGINPILLRVESKAGHGYGKPTAKIINELSDTLGFLAHVLRRKSNEE